MHRLLIVDNDDGLIHFLGRLFVKQGYEVSSAGDGASALRLLAEETFDAILLDYKMPGLNGLETLEEIKRMHVRTPVVIMTAHGTTETAIEAMKCGAYDYLLKPFDTDELRRVVADAIQVHQVMKDVVSIAGGSGRVEVTGTAPTQIVGSHRKMQEVFKLIGQVAARDVTVLITGESGTGKELIAEALHANSPRRDGPFVIVNMAAVPENLIESELFGHVAGAFTGSTGTRVGRFEAASGGTLFIDEIGDLALECQAKLLRVLENHRVTPVGSNEDRTPNVRVISATNRDLEKMVRSGEFREELYYRLNVVTIALPPLRNRPEDIGPLVHHFLDDLARTYDRPAPQLDAELMEFLQSYSWPGNIRQLRNCVESMFVLADSPRLTLADLPPMICADQRSDACHVEFPEGLTLEEVERSVISQTLDRCQGNRTQAARSLGISVRTLQRRLKRWAHNGR